MNLENHTINHDEAVILGCTNQNRQKNTDVMTSDNVVIASDQAPIKPMKVKDTAVATPSFRFENCHATRNNMINMKGAGVDTNAVSNELRIKSIGTRIAWNNGRPCSTNQFSPDSTQVSTGSTASAKGSSGSKGVVSTVSLLNQSADGEVSAD